MYAIFRYEEQRENGYTLKQDTEFVHYNQTDFVQTFVLYQLVDQRIRLGGVRLCVREHTR
jgi:hypothetical protein